MNLTSLVIKVAAISVAGYFIATSAEDLIAGVTDSVSVTTAKSDMKLFHTKFSEFYTMNGRYPNPGAELMRFLEEEFDTPLRVTIKDPWGIEYLFFGQLVEIRCCGPDKKVLTRDDLLTNYPPNRIIPVTGATSGRS